MNENRTYISIDLKSFYASVECVDRGLDPLTTNLVVADPDRTEKTICLAVSPSLKSFGISGRARLFEVVERIKDVNNARRYHAPGRRLGPESYHYPDLMADPTLTVSYIVAPPRMARYMEVSTKVHEVYLKYMAPEDIYVYSIDEVFLDVTGYLHTYHLSAHDLAMKMILDVLETTGITATAGIGTNLYLCKVAMDIMAKHIPADENGVRIAQLDEMTYRRSLWDHRPLTDFWRVGRGYAKKLENAGIHTMGDIALTSTTQSGENMLYKMFGVNAELLIDHAWGWEPCTLADIRAYKPASNSLSAGQVLKTPYQADQARIVVREMAEAMALSLVEKGLITDQIVLTVGYDTENLSDPNRRAAYKGEVKTDRYGRKIPKHAHGTQNLSRQTSSGRLILSAVSELYDRIVDPALLIRRMNLTANRVVPEAEARKTTADGAPVFTQLDFFTDYEALEKEQAAEDEALEKERRLQEASLALKKRFGKNAVFKGSDLQEGATALERNRTIGGHKA